MCPGKYLFLDKPEEWYTHADRAWLPSMSMGPWEAGSDVPRDVAELMSLALFPHPVGLGTEAAGHAGTEERFAFPPLALATSK